MILYQTHIESSGKGTSTKQSASLAGGEDNLFPILGIGTILIRPRAVEILEEESRWDQKGGSLRKIRFWDLCTLNPFIDQVVGSRIIRRVQLVESINNLTATVAGVDPGIVQTQPHWATVMGTCGLSELSESTLRALQRGSLSKGGGEGKYVDKTKLNIDLGTAQWTSH